MSVPFISLAEIKTLLGKTGTDDDLLIASIASNASAMAERATSRIFGVQSNVTLRYSTEGQASLTIHDHPYNDATRVVTLGGGALTQDSSYWLLQDRRNPDVSITFQLQPYDRTNPNWYKAFPNWFDANMDSPRYINSGAPNDLVIVGTVGHPVTPPDVKQGTLDLAEWLYWRTKGGASSYAESLAGTDVALQALQNVPTFAAMVNNWKVRTAVVPI